MKVFAFFETLIESSQREKRMKRVQNYRNTLNSFASFLEHKDISFADMNEEMIKGYEKWLQSNGVTPNSSSFYIRNLRAVYNHAVEQGYAERTFMFESVYTGVDKATPRPAISEDAIARLVQLDLKSMRGTELARDIFVFSYCMRGMGYKDIVFLKKSDVVGNYIRYKGSKTGKTEMVRIELITKSIILRYAEKTKDSEYLFPVITQKNPEKAYSQYQGAMGYYNKRLKVLGQMIGESIPLTHNVARNTWAKNAQNHDIPVSVIGTALGISTEKATQDFLDSLVTSEADIANSTILASLNNTVAELTE